MQQVPAGLQSAIQTLLRERQIFGLAVCGFDREGVRFAGGFGYADLDRGERVTEDTIFRVGSISKLLTTAFVLKLADSKQLDLDRDTNSYLPEPLRVTDQAGQPAEFELRRLLSHSAGLEFGVRGVDSGNVALSYLANGGHVRNLTDAITGLKVNMAPGKRVVYSNPAFNLAGFIAAQAVGLPFEQAVQQQVLDPLGMTDSAFTPQRRGPGVATPYGALFPLKVGSKPVDRLRVLATPMGGLTTNVSDLARFGQMLLNQGQSGGEEFLTAKIVDSAMTLKERNHPALDQGFGLGLKVRTWRGRRSVGHDGNMPGVAAQLILCPEDGVGAVVLTNGYSLAVPHQVAALVLEHLLELPADTQLTSPPSMTRAEMKDWEALGRRIEGSYQLRDSTPPGLGELLNRFLLRISVTHEAAGRLRIEGSPGSDGPAWLIPTATLGQYRIAAGVDNGTNAVVDEQPDGVHLWLGFATHLHKR